MTTTLLFGELRTGKITDALDATDASWSQVLNAAGAVDSVKVPAPVVRAKQLRQSAAAARCFLALEQDGQIRQAGPIWSRSYSWESETLKLGAGGLWSLFDHRKVIPVLAVGQRVQEVTTTVSGTDLGGIARALVAQALTHVGGDLPLVLPPTATGTRTETFPGWQLADLGEQLVQLTRRETAAPDIRFRPRRKPSDPTSIEWVMEVGTEAAPLLVQGGADWIFDTTSPQSPVVGISTDEDATVMGERGWVTGNGSEADTLIGTDYRSELVDGGYPLMEVDETRPSVEVQATLDSHARNLTGRTARPVEVWKVSVAAAATLEVQAGDYAQVVTAGDTWLPDGARRMRIKQLSGDLGDVVRMDMYPLQAVL